MTEIAAPEALSEAIENQDWDRVEELWLEALDRRPIPTDGLLEARRLLWKAGRKSQAMTLLELLVETLEANANHAGALAALRDWIRLSGKAEASRIERLEKAFVAVREGSPSLEIVMKKFGLKESRHPLETLKDMERWLDHDLETPVEVLGQGVGRVIELNLELDNLKVDLGGRRPVSIPFGAISKYVRVLPEGSFLRLKVEDPENLQTRVATEPGESLVHILEGFEEPADVAAIKNALDGLLPVSNWTSWWSKARKHPRILSSGSGSRLRYSVSGSAEDAADALAEKLRAAAGRDRLKAARDLGHRGEAEGARAAELLAEGLDDLVTTDPGLAWETAEVLDTLPGGAPAAAQCRARLAESAVPLGVLSGIKDRGGRQSFLEFIRTERAEDWADAWAEWLLHEKSAGLLDVIARRLSSEGFAEVLDATLETIFRNHGAHAAQFVWAAEAMTVPGAPEPLVRRMRPSMLEKIPDILTRREFSDFRSRGKALLEGGKVAVRLILEQASPEQAARFVQRISRIDTVDPGQLRLLEQAARQAGGTPSTEGVEVLLFVATQASIDAKREELKNLLEHEIPKTLKGINAAAAEGDLRENFEYHMLRDRQELQSAQAAKLQEDLGRVRVLEPGAADTSKVNIGTTVHFDEQTGVEPVTILGAWDTDIDARIYANGTELAKALLGRTVGDTVTVEGIQTRIVRIEAWG